MRRCFHHRDRAVIVSTIIGVSVLVYNMKFSSTGHTGSLLRASKAETTLKYEHRAPRMTDHLPPEVSLSDKYIIYRCHHGLCGGLADRQKGIVTSYIISQMLRRKFGIIMNKGCDFTKYVIPNQVDWIVDGDNLKEKDAKVLKLIDNKGEARKLSATRLEDMFDKDVTFYEGNMDYIHFLMDIPSFKTIRWAENKTHHEVFQIAFDQLFRLTASSLQRYETFQKQMHHRPLTCVHMRMGKSETLPGDVDLAYKHPNVTLVMEFLKQNITQFDKLFVATDSMDVRQQFQKSFPQQFVELVGAIVHIDRAGSTFDCSGLEKAILDQHILSTCRTLVMSNSGFSRIAAILRGSDNRLYHAQKNILVKTQRLDPTPYL